MQKRKVRVSTHRYLMDKGREVLCFMMLCYAIYHIYHYYFSASHINPQNEVQQYVFLTYFANPINQSTLTPP